MPIAHSAFASWEPAFERLAMLGPDELGGYETWRKNNGGVFAHGYDGRGALCQSRRDGNSSIRELRGGSVGDFASIDAHLAVLSGRLSRVFGPAMRVTRPAPTDQHWYRWAGDLDVPDQPESGWDIDRIDGEWQTAAAERQWQPLV